MYSGRRVFKLGQGFTLLYIAVTALFVAGAWAVQRTRGWNWVAVGLAIAAAFSVAAASSRA